MKALYLTLIGILAASCATTPEINYYALSAPPGVHEKGTDARGPSVAFEKLELADYIKNSGLTLEMANGQLRPANYHAWSEPLSAGLHRVITLSLIQQAENFQLNDSQAKPNYRLTIYVSKFNGTEDGDVFLQGRWTLTHTADSAIIKSQAFDYTEAIAQNGYPALVRSHSNLAVTLATDIATNLKTVLE